jgi:hypothetical protein
MAYGLVILFLFFQSCTEDNGAISLTLLLAGEYQFKIQCPPGKMIQLYMLYFANLSDAHTSWMIPGMNNYIGFAAVKAAKSLVPLSSSTHLKGVQDTRA